MSFLSFAHSELFKGQSASSTPTSATLSRLLRFGAVVLTVGAVLMLCASMAALFLWKVSEKNVSEAHPKTTQDLTTGLIVCHFLKAVIRGSKRCIQN